MAGYFTKNDGHVYEGELPMQAAGVTGIKSGLFVEVYSDGVKFPTTVTGYAFKVVEVYSMDGQNWARANVVSAGANPVYLVEQVASSSEDILDSGEVEIKVGDPVRMRRPVPNDQIALTLPEGLAVEVGDVLVPVAATGVVAVSA